MCLGGIVDAGIGGGGEQNARVADERAQVVELSDGPARGTLGEQKGAHQSVGAERITHRRLDGRRHSLMKVDGVLKMFGPRLADVRDDSYLGYARKRRRTRTGQRWRLCRWHCW